MEHRQDWKKYYSARSGIELEKGASKLLWIAMGMQKGPLAEGWYDVSLIDMMNEASETGKTEKYRRQSIL